LHHLMKMGDLLEGIGNIKSEEKTREEEEEEN
jgi:hypothetical protein